MAPEGWLSTRLGNAFESRREPGKEGLPTLSVTLNDGLVDRSSLDRKTDSALLAEEHLAVMPGDIAYNMMRMWQGASGLAEKEGLVSPAYVVLKANESVYPAYMAYLFKSTRMIHSFWAYSYGLTDDRLRLYFKDFCAIPVTLPTKNEQVRIAEALQTWDRAIDVNLKLLANSESQHTALMQQMFSGQQRPATSSGEYLTRHLKQLVRIDAKSLGTSTPPDFRFRYISLSDVGPRSLVVPPNPIRFDEAPSRARRIVSGGDILMATVRPNLQAFAMVPEGTTDCVASTGFAVLTANPDINASYIFHYLFSGHISSQIEALVVGSNYPAIGSKEVGNLVIRIPGLEQQTRIAKVLNDSSQSIVSHRRRLEAVRLERTALMELLLTGKRRLNMDKEKAA